MPQPARPSRFRHQSNHRAWFKLMPEERSPFGSGLTDMLKCQRLAEFDDPIAVKV
jgi:hypothetical protein